MNARELIENLAELDPHTEIYYEVFDEEGKPYRLPVSFGQDGKML